MNETSAPDDGTVRDMQEQPPVEAPPQPVPAPVKPKTNVPLFIAGLVTPVAIFALLAVLASWILSDIFTMAIPGLFALLFVVFLILFLQSKTTGDIRRRSFMKGALWAYAAIPLFFLLMFGTCLVGLNQAPV